MSQSSNKLYEFGGFRLDAAERVLWRGEELLVLPPKVFETLLVLVEKEGRVVSKSELMAAVWADAFVEESNMSQNIYTLRRTLGVDEQGRQFIETVPRRGYRLAVPVKLLAEDSIEIASEAEEVVSDAPATGSAADTVEVNSDSNDPQELRTPEAQTASAATHGRRRTSSRYALWAGVAVLILSALGLGIYKIAAGRGEKAEPSIAPIEQIRFQRLTDSGDVVSATIAPGGELVAYVRHDEEGESVWVKQIATGSSFQILPASPKGYRSLVFSPDGRYLFFREEADPGAIYQTPAFGGTLRTVANNVWSDFSLSPDGKQFAFVRRDTARNDSYLLVVSDVDGTGERELSAKQAPLSYRSALAWSPDGARLVVTAGSQRDGLPRLVTVDVSTGEETELKTPRWRAVSRALWSPNGDYLIVSAREINETTSQLWMLGFPDGGVRRLTNDLEAYFWVSLSSDGRMLVTRQQRIVTHLWLIAAADLKRARQLTFGGRSLDGYVGLAWTPEGKIVFTGFASNFTDLYSMDEDGGNRAQLTANAGQDNTNPTVSRDGRYVVFTSNRTGARQIWRSDIDGRNQKQLTFDEGQKESAQHPALSPDGEEVYFIKQGAGPSAIWKVAIDGGTPVQVSRLTNAATEGFLSISPDGKWLAYRHVSVQPEARSEEPSMRIGVIPADGSAEPMLFDLPMRRPGVQWSADSEAFDYVAGTLNSSSLVRQPLDGGEPERLFVFPDRIFNFAWSKDWKNLAVSRGKQQGDAILITNLP